MTPEAVKADYAAIMDRVGETVLIRRYSGSGSSRTATDVSVRARVVSYDPKELVGGIQQGDAKVIALAEDLDGSAITLPLVKSDKCVVRGRELNIQGSDDNTRRIQGVLVAYELQVRG
jgi:hypothetical protein